MKAIKTDRYLLTTVICLVLSVSCGRVAQESHSHEEEHEHDELILTQHQLNTVGIELGRIEQKEIGKAINANGVLSVSPQDIADVTPLLSGVIKTIAVAEGQSVKAGQIVATIENPDIITNLKDYREAIDELNLAKSQLSRQEQLSKEGAGIRKNLEKAQSDYAIAQTRADALKQRLKAAGISLNEQSGGEMSYLAAVRAPISGVVNKIYSSIGSMADISRPIMTITNNSNIYATLTIYEKDLSKVNVGQKVYLSLTNGDFNFEGVVEQINKTIDVETKGINVKVKIDKEYMANLIPGMAVNAYINSEAGLYDVLPEEAIVTIGGKNFIYVMEKESIEDGETEYHFEPVEVATGSRLQGYIEVKPIEAISENSLIVTKKAFYLASMTADHGEHNH